MTHVINFSPQFATLVRSGAKTQTIRPVRKQPIKPGDTLRLYTGLRTKKCTFLREVICAEVMPCRIDEDDIIVFYVGEWGQNVIEILGKRDIRKLVVADGFATHKDFVAWFCSHYGLPFDGVVIKWRLTDANPK